MPFMEVFEIHGSKNELVRPGKAVLNCVIDTVAFTSRPVYDKNNNVRSGI